MNLIKALWQFAAGSVRALAHPEDEREWRFAWEFFVFPVFVGGTAAGVSALLFWLLPSVWEWLAVFVWLFYILFCEPYMFFVEGDGFERMMDWVENGGE